MCVTACSTPVQVAAEQLVLLHTVVQTLNPITLKIGVAQPPVHDCYFLS